MTPMYDRPASSHCPVLLPYRSEYGIIIHHTAPHLSALISKKKKRKEKRKEERVLLKIEVADPDSHLASCVYVRSSGKGGRGERRKLVGGPVYSFML
jgi:hypothetical protein